MKITKPIYLLIGLSFGVTLTALGLSACSQARAQTYVQSYGGPHGRFQITPFNVTAHGDFDGPEFHGMVIQDTKTGREYFALGTCGIIELKPREAH